MAQLYVEGSELVVGLSWLEQLGALCGGVRVPLSQVRSVRVSDEPYAELRGLRVGTGIPWVVVLGRMVTWDNGTDFVAVYGRKDRTVIVELAEGAPFARLLLTGQGESIVTQLQARLAN